MDKNNTRTAVMTALLVAGAMLLGSVAFPRMEAAPGPIPDELPPEAMRIEAEPAPALEPPRRAAAEPDTARAALRAQLETLEQALADIRTQHEAAMARLEPLLQALAEHERARLGGGAPQKNESAAIATLRNSTSAQAQMQATARIDVDHDGTGEYGGYLELSGSVAGRMQSVLVPPVLSSAFRKMTDGVVVRAGYCYRIFLPGPRGRGVAEPATGFADDGSIDPDLAETTWCAYAWPMEYGKTGTRTYFANQAGDVLSTDDSRYSGPAGGPEADAAFRARAPGGILGPTAVGSKGNDGNLWQQRG